MVTVYTVVASRNKPCELREYRSVKTAAILIQALYVREGATTIPQGSTGKCPEAHGTNRIGDDIVWSASKDAAVRKDDDDLTNHHEHFDYLGGFALTQTQSSQARIVKWDSAA